MERKNRREGKRGRARQRNRGYSWRAEERTDVGQPSGSMYCSSVINS